MEKPCKLLFITQKIDEQDDDLAFVTQWVDTFIAQGFLVEVICLEKGTFDGRFPVYSLGKELGYGKIKRTVRFLKFITTLQYERVFVHMNPEYFTLGGWWWFATHKPSYLWYTHYATHIHLRLAALFCKRMFAATAQSLPQYNHNPKKVVTGHGVNTQFWTASNVCNNEKNLVMVHRLSRSKRVELGIKALAFLPPEYTLTIYGRPIDAEYYRELTDLVTRLQLSERVIFKGPLPMPELRAEYPKYRIMINMASETIDKTMLEAMCNGVYPVTTRANLQAIGLSEGPSEETPQMIAEFIKNGRATALATETLATLVREKHSLQSLVHTMGGYIKSGT